MIRWIGFVVLTFCVQLTAQTATKQCNTSELPEDAHSSMALTYIEQDRRHVKSACIVKAIQILREEMCTQATSTLMRYLDFQNPSGISYDPMTQPPTGTLYPAVDALARFGDVAVPALKSAVRNEKLTKVARVNAAEALFVGKDKKAQVIIFLVKAAQSSQHPDVANALTKLAKEAAQHCMPEESQQCSDAVNSQ